jgi:hypothetical protein
MYWYKSPDKSLFACTLALVYIIHKSTASCARVLSGAPQPFNRARLCLPRSIVELHRLAAAALAQPSARGQEGGQRLLDVPVDDLRSELFVVLQVVCETKRPETGTGGGAMGRNL